jgi:hypothetical protein
MSNGSKSTLTFMLLLTLVVLVGARTLAAQARRIAPAPGEKTFSGQVSEIKEQLCGVCNCVELSVVLKTDSGARRSQTRTKNVLRRTRFRPGMG